MNRVRDKCLELQGHTLYAEYVETEKNQIANNFLENQDFIKVKDDKTILQKLEIFNCTIDGTLYVSKLG
jgi:predicted enzyme involved in methoxymalonyl-ACP biosynthesis